MKISINLLPPELITKELKKANFYKIQFAGIVVILVMVFLASLTVVLRILQSRSIKTVQARVTQAQQRISDLKDTQVALLLLKSRLGVIVNYLGVSSNQTIMYRLIGNLVPAGVTINSIGVGKTGEVTLTALAPDTPSLDDLINKLTVSESNEERISLVAVDSLNRGRDGLYRVSLTIKPK